MIQKENMLNTSFSYVAIKCTLHISILSTGKKHDITELNSDAVNLISHATQERLRGLLEKLTTIAQHRMTTYKVKEIIRENQALLSPFCSVKGSFLLWIHILGTLFKEMVET